MPHDKNGNLLNVGDEVIVRAKVSSVQAGNDYCNVSLQTVEPMFPSDQPTTMTLNTKQVEKVQLAEAGTSQAEPEPGPDAKKEAASPSADGGDGGAGEEKPAADAGSENAAG